jgi:hypothetical protein
MSDSTPTVQVVRLKSPFNGEVKAFELQAGVPPTLETLLARGYVIDEPKKEKRDR